MRDNLEKATLLLAICLLTGNAQADPTYPENGLWWDPNASGRGYIIERQENTMFIISFHYSSDGDPEWLTSQGTYEPIEDDESMGIFNGAVFLDMLCKSVLGRDLPEHIQVSRSNKNLLIFSTLAPK